MVCVVHYFKGKLLLPEEAAPEQQLDPALLSLDRIDSTMEKYLGSQVSGSCCLILLWANLGFLHNVSE